MSRSGATKHRRSEGRFSDPSWKKGRHQVGLQSLEIVNHYIDTQQALGNWPHDNVWEGDPVILSLIDTYEAVANDYSTT